MEFNRRDMMSRAAAFALLASATDHKSFAQAVVNSPRNGVDVTDYWTNFYDDASSKKSSAGNPLAVKGRETVYLHAPDSGAGLAYATNIPRTTLPAIQGDVMAKVSISQYRPGKGDINTDVSHLRIDAVQPFDAMNVIAPLSWATIASITPPSQASKLPTIDQLGFHAQASADGQNLKQILLPGGLGKLAVNVTQPANSKMSDIVKEASTGITAVLSMMTLPAISVPAIKVFSELFGKWQNRAHVIMNGNLTQVIATSTPAGNIELSQEPMALPSGYLVMFPKEHQTELSSQFNNLVLQNGFLVRKDAPDSQDLETRAKTAVEGVTYATLRVYVDKAPTAGCSKNAGV